MPKTRVRKIRSHDFTGTDFKQRLQVGCYSDVTLATLVLVYSLNDTRAPPLKVSAHTALLPGMLICLDMNAAKFCHLKYLFKCHLLQ